MPGTHPKLQQIVIPDPRALLEAAADGFLRWEGGTPADPFPTPRYLLALRQGGLRDELYALAAAQGIPGWFDPPLAVFHELPRWLGETSRRPCDDFERAVILGGVLRSLGGEIFGRRLQRPEDFLRSIERLVGELAAEGVTPEAFSTALDTRSGRDPFERERDHELARIYESYMAALDAAGRRDGRDSSLDSARAIAADPEGLARRLRGRREIRIVGLNDLRGGWRPLLAALLESPVIDRVTIYTSDPLELDGGVTPPAELRAPGPGTRCDLIAAPDTEREMEEVARRVRELADHGVPLTDIAVVARQARPCVDLALTALEKFGVPATARRRIALREIPVVRAMRALFAAAAEGWSRHSLVELAEQPYFASELDAGIINFAGFRRRVSGLDAWERALRTLAREAEREESMSEEEREALRSPLPPSARLRAAADGIAAFAAHARPLGDSRTLAAWVAWLSAFLRDDPWGVHERMHGVPGDRFDVVRVDLAGWKALKAIVESWEKALGNWGGANDRIGAAEFAAQLADLLDGDAALWTPVMHGVRVLEGFAAVYRSFAHLFIVGMEAGQFPVRSPASPLLDEWERRELAAAGMPFEVRERWERRERQLFQTLLAGGRESVTISYARQDPAGREVVRSSFVDRLVEAARLSERDIAISSARVLTPGARLYLSPEAPARARHAFAIEFARAQGALTPWNGLIESPALRTWLEQEFGDDRLWSPTQLESFAKCPWSYFASRLLGITRLEDPGEEMESTTRGAILHDALHRFYDRAQERTGGPVFLRDVDLEWARPMLAESLDAALADARGRAWLGHPALQAAKRAELVRLLTRFIEFEAEEHEAMAGSKGNAPRMVRTAVKEHEAAFRDVVLERNGVRFRFRGSVDRVEIGVDDRFEHAERHLAAVDYKTTKYAAPGGGKKEAWDDDVVLQVPLYAYALSREHPGAAIARVEYRALRKPEAVHRLELYQVTKAGLTANLDGAARMERALDAVTEHVKRARGGSFPAEPARSCGCPSFCASLEICRVAGGPRTRER
ncbi:MAG TPA: PD-(D/E)XK nuclease family protein [Gemmatimonadales bacterium]|nr:PD-(D/E)XK nuclease family protein [Gemmatimonadales bacterium]